MMRTSGDLKSGAALLTSTNVVCAAIGAVQGLAVVRLLGADLFGAAAVIVAISSIATNLIDVRITDLVSRLYFDERTATAGDRAAVLRLGLAFSAAGGALITLLSAAGMFLLAHALTSAALRPSWFWMAAAAQGIVYVGSFFVFVQRFVAPPRQMAILQLCSALINAAAMLGCVAAHASIGGYALGILCSTAGTALVNGIYALAIFRRAGMDLLTGASPLPSFVNRRVIVPYIAAGNILGYVKLLHRSADVLLVSYLCGTTATGIYKLARSMTDTLYAISEAMGRVYQPRLLALLRDNEHSEYWDAVRTMLAVAALVTIAAITSELTLLRYGAPLLRVTAVDTLTMSVVALTLPFFFVAGLQTWMWPVIVYVGRLGSCTAWATAGVLLGQYAAGPALFFAVGDGNPVWLCVGYLCYYPISLLPLLRDVRRELADPTWRMQEATL